MKQPKFDVNQKVYTLGRNSYYRNTKVTNEGFLCKMKKVIGIVISENCIRYILQNETLDNLHPEMHRDLWVREEDCFASLEEMIKDLTRIINETYKDEK